MNLRGVLLSLIILSSVILFFLVAVNPIQKISKHKIGIDADLEDVQLQNNLMYVKLKSGVVNKEIEGVKFIVKDKDGNEHVYETTEGTQNLSIEYNRSLLDIVRKPKLEGGYDYSINVSALGIDNPKDIASIAVVFKYKPKIPILARNETEVKSKESPVLDKEKVRTSSGGGSGGSSSSSSSSSSGSGDDSSTSGTSDSTSSSEGQTDNSGGDFVRILTSESADSNSIMLALDGNISTRWAAMGRTQWIEFYFSNPVTVNGIKINFFYDYGSRNYNLGIQISDNGINWSTILDTQSSGRDANPETFSFPETTTHYLRILAGGYVPDGVWNSYYELNWLYNGEEVPLTNIISCGDGIKNGDEEGIDCGGSCNIDCCSNGFMDSDLGETGVDCGGSCDVCPTCDDGIQNQGEIGIDCGGPCPDQTCCSNNIRDYALGETGVDCGSSTCGVCSPTCSDEIKNGDETGVDCGGSCGTDCCSNGFMDSDLGETGVDCGSVCNVDCHVPVTYYISNNGDDSNDGLSSGSPWKTISKVNQQHFGPGDSILFERGGLWRETLEVHDSGNREAYIHYGAYGTGEKPRIWGSEVSNWVNDTGNPNIWRSVEEFPNPFDNSDSEIWFVKDGGVTWSTHVHHDHDFWSSSDYQYSVLNELDSEYQTTWVGEGCYRCLGNVYVYSPENPSSRYDSIEIPVRRTAIELNDNNYLSFDNLELRYLLEKGINEDYNANNVYGLRVTNCEIGYMGIKGGANMYGLSLKHSDSYIANNTIHDCGRRSVSFNLYDYDTSTHSDIVTLKNVLIENNYFYHGYHTTGVDINNQDHNIIYNVTIRNNLFEGDPSIPLAGVNPNSNHIFIANQGEAGFIGDLMIYNNIFTYAHGKSIAFERVNNAGVYYNTFYKWNPTLSDSQTFISLGGAYDKNISIKNNIFYNDRTLSSNRGLHSIFVSKVLECNFSFDNNLYYDYDTQEHRVSFQDDGIDQDYGAFNWDQYLIDYSPNDAHSLSQQDPLFVDGDGGDFHLQGNSPAIEKAVPIAGITTDYEGNLRDPSSPDIGAFEYKP